MLLNGDRSLFSEALWGKYFILQRDQNTDTAMLYTLVRPDAPSSQHTGAKVLDFFFSASMAVHQIGGGPVGGKRSGSVITSVRGCTDLPHPWFEVTRLFLPHTTCTLLHRRPSEKRRA